RSLSLFFSRAPSLTHPHPLSLHDALPICVAVSSSHLETRDTFFRKFFDDRPSLALRKFTAVLFLHRDIIFFYLSFGRDSIEAIYSLVFFHDCTLSFLV